MNEQSLFRILNSVLLIYFTGCLLQQNGACLDDCLNSGITMCDKCDGILRDLVHELASLK